jgi:hypothetical protein
MSQNRSTQTAKSPGFESKTQHQSSGYSVPVTSIHKVEADGFRVFYRGPATRILRWCCCCTGSQHRLSCSGNSFHVSPTTTA